MLGLGSSLTNSFLATAVLVPSEPSTGRHRSLCTGSQTAHETMADPVAGVERIVKLGLAIKTAVDTVRQNEEVCHEIRRRVLRFSDILSQLQRTGLMDGSPAMSGALEDLEESLRHALELVTACQERGTIRRFITAGDLARQLRRVKDDILNKVMLASFAINVQTSIVLLTIQAGGGGHPLPWLQQDMGAAEMSQNILSTNDASDLQNSALREFKLSELMAATDNFSIVNIIGQGASSTVFKGDFNDGKLVAIKKVTSNKFGVDIYDLHLIASKLQHKNIVKVLGYAAHEVRFAFGFWPWKGKKAQAEEPEYYFVEEYLPNRSLYEIIQEPQLEWSSLFRIIQGVAEGLHCLHRQRVVHRDVKPANILLDSDMNPKITDLELITVLDDDDEIKHFGEIIGSLSDIKHLGDIIGTLGYLDPACFEGGSVSTKVDVYAFGITLLETVGSIRVSKQPRELPYDQWAWEAWADGRLDEEFDGSLFDGSQLMEIRRCVEIGLLCAQHDRADRPSMADVLKMLNGNIELPTPKKPGYIKLPEEWPEPETAPGSPAAWSEGSCSPR
ncbi:hypothetical protein ACP4OV_001996 [Aristida adscensionis]